MKENTKHKLLLESIESLKEQLPLLREKIRNAKNCGAGKCVWENAFGDSSSTEIICNHYAVGTR